MRSHLLKFAYEVIYDMKENINKIFAPNLICVCIDTVENGDYIGKFWHQYDDKPRSFRNMTELLRNMEALYDEWDFPQKSTILRSFNNKRGDAGLRQGRRDAEYNARRIENKHGEKGTFVIYVKYRQNATWQGEVVWSEGNLKISFRSALELIKIIDNTFEIGNAETTLAHG